MRVTVYVRPGAHATGIGGEHGGALVVRVRERAVDGKATEAALAALASSLGLPRSAVRLVTGATSRLKIVEIPDSASDRFAELSAAPRPERR